MNQEQVHAARGTETHELYTRVGEITRRLHDALRELGYDKQIEASLGRLPDARARLSFIARLTGDAAEKVLDTVDAAQAQQEALAAQAAHMQALLLANPSALVANGELLGFVGQVKENAQRTSSQLTEIMLAQDFHDLTGQTVRKVVEVASNLEDSLVQLLLETSPPGAVEELGAMNGPVAEPSARTDVVSGQAQVDDLLESLGF
jgi:chemotaxis protein CheZ